MNRRDSSRVYQVVDIDDYLANDIERAACRDFAALERLHQCVGGKLAAICLRITGSSESAEDALQEVYIKLWNRAGSYDRSLSRPMTWLSTLARNTAIDLARAQRRTQADTLPFDFDDEDLSPRVDDCLIEQERQRKAVNLLERLGDKQRELIREVYLRGSSYSELSEQLGIPVGTIKSRIHRGLVTLKRSWKGD
jgi:RNA polymerase sigma-70 factor (ECF subfamily)